MNNSEPKCWACQDTGWVTRDPDIGTDQECFACESQIVTKTSPYDVAAKLRTEEERIAYIQDMTEEFEGDPEVMTRVARDVERSRTLNP